VTANRWIVVDDKGNAIATMTIARGDKWIVVDDKGNAIATTPVVMTAQ
jgi:hypothetical protein